ncbi:Bifunctional peptidase and (3S)-lysyl hydroxylase Jmjd7 [Fulvia fulva]|nr:Bifunctional peptidase and (3S)-lysyl hydroxylase Jmjd7 [Fulvia fulva]
MAGDPLVALITSYHELNPSLLDELEDLPTALEFSTYTAKNRPFVVRGGARNWSAVQRWDAAYLATVLKDKDVKVAVTPHGNADAVVEDESGRLLFVEPHEIHESFSQLLRYVQEDSKQSKGLVKYAQPQNDSLRLEYPELFPDVPKTMPFASEALNQEPDAINFWLGNDRSTTSLHKDNYENIYAQIRGQKHFVLLPPVEIPCVNETPLQFARYHPSLEHEHKLEPGLDTDTELIPVPLWDPDEPDTRSTVYSKHSKSLRVTLYEGDIMYLPAMWYHKVRQGNGPEGFSCSVNYWYDMEFGGSFWTSTAFIRDVYNARTKEVNYPELKIENDEDARTG